MGQRGRLRLEARQPVDLRHEPVGIHVFEAAEHFLPQPVALGVQLAGEGLQARCRFRKLRRRGLEHAERDVYLAHGPERPCDPAEPARQPLRLFRRSIRKHYRQRLAQPPRRDAGLVHGIRITAARVGECAVERTQAAVQQAVTGVPELHGRIFSTIQGRPGGPTVTAEHGLYARTRARRGARLGSRHSCAQCASQRSTSVRTRST
jgi:hypothetical protein